MKPKKINLDISPLTSQDMFRVYSRCELNAGDSAKFLGIPKKAFLSRWKELEIPKPATQTYKDTDNSLSDYHEIGLISDLHFGSLWQKKTALNNFCNILRDRNIDTLVCCGYLSEGTMSWYTHHKERFLHCAESYEEYLADNYPGEFKNNYFILGNHDNSLKRHESEKYDLGKELLKNRRDLCYHDQDSFKISKEFKLPGLVSFPAIMAHILVPIP